MPGLYIHIPFCESRCIYCDFYSTTEGKAQERYVDALCREYEARKAEIMGSGDLWDTIYIGGGTPSTLRAEHLKRLFMLFACDMKNHEDMEITMECNPDDITAEYADMLAELPVNRISMGAQTFDDSRLRFLRRRHSSSQIADAVHYLRSAGFGNISIDLMYGFPNETADDFQNDIENALALKVPHISAYCLMYEEGTTLYEMLKQGKTEQIAEETEREMYDMLATMLKAAGYEHYEISNFAREGFRSRHNGNYWNLTPYLGIGAAAHSFNGKDIRSFNPSNLAAYMEAVENSVMPTEREILSTEEQYNDFAMLRLRTSEGINLDETERIFGSALRQKTEQAARRFIDGGLLAKDAANIHLTHDGLFVSNMIMSEFMLTD